MIPLIMQANLLSSLELSVFSMRFHKPIAKKVMLIRAQQIETSLKIQLLVWLLFAEVFLIKLINKDV
jgi:hypothetical protein